MPSTTAQFRFIDRELRRIELMMRGVVHSYPLNPLPDELYEAMAGSMDVSQTDTAESRLQAIYQDTLMKPSLCTFSYEGPFPVNAAYKIVRLTLTDEAIEDTIDEIEGRLLALQGLPFNETIDGRMELYRDNFVDDTKIDRFRLGVMEIYGDATYRNLLRDPRASLVMYWRDKKSNYTRSVQINAIAEIVEPGTPFYRYMLVMRSLFSSRFLDMRREGYVAAYKLWVSEVHDKSLMPKTGFVPDSSNL